MCILYTYKKNSFLSLKVRSNVRQRRRSARLEREFIEMHVIAGPCEITASGAALETAVDVETLSSVPNMVNPRTSMPIVNTGAFPIIHHHFGVSNY